MYGRTRIDMQHEILRSCVKLDKLKTPGVRSTPNGTKAEVANEKLYEYNRGIYQRLEGCLHAAFVELDTYLNQLGLMQRVASAEELEK
eukprot:7926762-Heterocapsa_arctica.AAC.1